MDIKQLKYFLHVSQNNSLTQTARKLFITEQGLSKVIRNLEEELSLPLFYRQGNRIELTKYGRFLQRKSKNLIREFDVFTHSIEKYSSSNNHEINIGYSQEILNTLSMDFLYRLINNFKKKNPDIKLKITEYEDSCCETALLNEDIDIAFTIGTVDRTLFDSNTLFTKRLCAIVSANDEFSMLNSISLEKIKSKKIIIAHRNFTISNAFINCCRSYGFEPNISFTTTNFNLLTHLICATKAIGIGLYLEGKQNVNFIPLKDYLCACNICVITRKNYHQPKSLKCFLNYLLKVSANTD